MKKQISFVILILVFIFSLFDCNIISFAQPQTTDIEKTRLGDTQTFYSYDALSKTLTISGEGNTPNVTIASGSQPWFSYRSDGSIEHVVVEEGVTSIGDYLFYFVSTADFKLPSTLISIGKYAMANTNAVVDLTLYDGLRNIADYAFYSAFSLKTINIPKTVTNIGQSAFENCISLSKVDFGDWNMELTIGRSAFFACSSLEEITVPKRASVSSNYTFGYYDTMAGSVYDGFTMYVYRNSSAHNYAQNNKAVNCVILDEMTVKLGDEIGCSYTSNNDETVYSFVFVPEKSGYYNFFSSGSVDVSCSLQDDKENILSEHNDNSASDLNFFVKYELEEGKTYIYKVSNYKSSSDFIVTLLPDEIDNIEITVDDVTADAADSVNGLFDITSQIENAQITVNYKIGFSHIIDYIPDGVYNGKVMSYSDNQHKSKWLCGVNYAYLSVDDVKADFPVTIAHSYAQSVIAPTFDQDGYTLYSCVLCDDSYKDNFVERLGMEIKGKVVLMQDIDGSHPDNLPLFRVEIASDDETVAFTDDNGEFRITAKKDEYTQLTAICAFGPPRTFDVSSYDKSGVCDIGTICLISCDYWPDGYINAKDYAELHRSSVNYLEDPDYKDDQDAIDDFKTIDYNRDGIIDDEDWRCSENLCAIGDLSNYEYPQ